MLLFSILFTYITRCIVINLYLLFCNQIPLSAIFLLYSAVNSLITNIPRAHLTLSAENTSIMSCCPAKSYIYLAFVKKGQNYTGCIVKITAKCLNALKQGTRGEWVDWGVRDEVGGF